MKKKMKAALKIYKIGGGIIDNASDLQEFLLLFANVSGPKILVHGGGKGASEMMARLGIMPRLLHGRRITDAAALDIVTMFYAGKTNKQIVAALQGAGVNALGLSGADGNVILAAKRPVREVDYGFVGDLSEESINADMVRQFLEMGLTPVFCAINHDGQGQLLNTNADTIAASLAKALSRQYAVELHFCFEKHGVLADIIDEKSVIPTITLVDYAELKESGIIADGMLPKLENAFDALQYGVEKVIIEHALYIDGALKTTLCLN
ncbi:acetylglutamate kinase [Hymenobacter sp. IS2118]|uniref:acetylglutamate kinase n=1 Tax=Hymenobacter sp. IS2118 TaxID=1505605 RepID=UPI0029341EA2|nr:acetylglutamate kinase [Hymenobacter sp. IS2118]